MNKSHVENVYLVGVHKYAFRQGEPAIVKAVKMITPSGLKPRLCYEIMFSDGVMDFIPISSVEHGDYKFINT